MESLENFQWGSMLGVSVMLFLLYGGLYVFVSFLAVVVTLEKVAQMMDTDRILYMSDKADVVYYGEAPRDLLAREPAVRKLRDTMFLALAALMCSAGLLVMAIAWFALRRGEMWALVALAVAGFAVVPFYGLMFAPYIRIGAPLVFSIPPYITVPGFLLIPAVVLGWLGLR